MNDHSDQDNNQKRLAALDLAGFRLEENGHLIFQTSEAEAPNQTGITSNKLQRNRFTREDDYSLAQWVLAARNQGINPGEMKVFEDLTAVDDRHTILSWRARYHTKMQNLTNMELSTKYQRPQSAVTVNLMLESMPSESVSPLQAADEKSTVKYHHEGFRENLNTGQSLSDSLTASGKRESRITTPHHFTELHRPTVEGRDTKEQSRNSSIRALIADLGLADRDELTLWLSQPWFLQVYDEYVDAVLRHINDPNHASPSGSKALNLQAYSSTTYLVNNSMTAIRAVQSRFTDSTPDKCGWTADDHEIRFIVALVCAGRKAGRYWSETTDDQIPRLCFTARRIAAWLRSVHKLMTSSGANSQWRLANSFAWTAMLSKASAEARLIQWRSEPSVTSHSSGAPRSVSDGTSDGTSTLHRTHSSQRVFSTTSNSDTQHASPKTPEPTRTGQESVSASSISYKDPEVHALNDRRPKEWTEEDQHRAESPIREHEQPIFDASQNAAAANMNAKNARIDPQKVNFTIPAVPNYSVKTAEDRHQQKGLHWLTEDAKNRFLREQSLLLSSWGVTACQEQACLLVPAVWRSADPLQLLEMFDPQDCPSHELSRLTFSMDGITVHWARASGWLAKQRGGVELDNFIGSGPFEPMEGSHLCHHGQCINPNHIVFEKASCNSSRNRCCYLARDLRQMQIDVPRHCIKHDPPCLLQVAALTHLESLLIQCNVLREARGLDPVVYPPSTGHPYATFEQKFPLSFASSSTAISPEELTETYQAAEDASIKSPIFYCRFCKKYTCRSVVGYWTHIRDKHRLVEEDAKLQEIRRAAGIWKEFLLRRRGSGSGIAANDPTWLKIEQSQARNFSWEVFMSWKLRTARER